MKRIIVKPQPNSTYKIGYKILKPDLEGRIITDVELTQEEKEAFYKHIARNPLK